jgi:2-polyprenyl-6-methoxyphenol hydroxylase-like FAD-dependent oxidoreductase
MQCIPTGSSGASQAIFDFETLAKHLSAKFEDVEGALEAYEVEKLPPTAKTVVANRANGPDHALQLAKERVADGMTTFAM